MKGLCLRLFVRLLVCLSIHWSYPLSVFPLACQLFLLPVFPSVGPSIGPFLRWSVPPLVPETVCFSIGQSVGPFLSE